VIIARLFILCCVFVAGSALSDHETRLREGGNAANIQLAGSEDPGTPSKVYIVQLRSPSAAQHFASLAGSFAGKVSSAPARSFDKNSAAVRSYTAELGMLQDQTLARISPAAKKIYSYRYTLNGFAVRMTDAEAHKLKHFEEVLNVWEDEIRPLATNFSPQFLGLFEPTVGLRGTPGLDGDGVIIAMGRKCFAGSVALPHLRNTGRCAPV
jgi:hypothetical protein